MNLINHSIFQEIRKSYKLKDIAEHYFGEDLVPIGSSYELESKACPFCGHMDCFRGKHHSDSPDDIEYFHCFSCDKTISDGPSLLVALSPDLNNYQAAEKLLADAKEHGFGERLPTRDRPKENAAPRATIGILNPSERLQAIFSSAESFYSGLLMASPSGIQQQVEIRKHQLEILSAHGVGLSNGRLGRQLAKEGFTQEELIQSGLIRDNGYDYFPAGVFVYSHRDKLSRPCDFTMKDPEGNFQFRLSKDFKLRGIQFYGEHTLLPSTKTIYLVEGENDWISCIEGGCDAAILATIGSISREQLSWLKENHGDKEICTLFDTDEAGDKYRSKFSDYGFPTLKQFVLPIEKSDPDEYLKKNHCSFDDMLQACTSWSAPDMGASASTEPSAISDTAEPQEDDFPRTDIGNADLLVLLSHARYRYVIEHKAWAHYDGKYWRFHQDHLALQLTRMVAETRLAWAAALPESNDREGKQKKQAFSYALSCQDQKRINPMLALAAKDPRIQVSVSDFDADAYLLGVANGVINLKTGELLPHDPALMISKSCKASYKPNSSYSRWIRALRRAIDEGDSTETEAGLMYLKKVLGMALIGKVLERSLFFIHGRPGTGKSLITNAVHNILGDYSRTLSPNSLMQSPYSSNDNKMPEIVHLKGVRFALASEADDGQRFNEPLLKRITGNDPISARDVFEKAICFVPQCTLFIVGNSRPTANGSQAFWERLKVISFNNQIPKAEQNSNFDQELLEEADGILSWMVQGCLAYQQEGLAEPYKVRMDSAAYQSELDTIALFIDEMCVVTPEGTASAPQMYLYYVDWTKDIGINPLGRTRFYEKLLERGLEKEKFRDGEKNPKARFKGISLRNA